MSDELDRRLQQLSREQAESAVSPIEWDAVSERADQAHGVGHVRRWPAVAAAAMLIVAGVVVIALVRGGGSETVGPVNLPGGPDRSEAAAPPTLDVSEFCEAYATSGEERSEDYVGSTEHLSDIQALLDVAPSEIAADVTTFRDFLSPGAIDSGTTPDKKVAANWPSEVRVAISRIQEFATRNCQSSPSPNVSGSEPSTTSAPTDGENCLTSATAQICATGSTGAIEVTASGLQPGSEFRFGADGVPDASYSVGPDGSIEAVGLLVPQGASVRLTVNATDADGQTLQGELIASG